MLHPPSLGAESESSTVPEHNMATSLNLPNLGSPTEPKKEVVPEPPPTPSTDPELHLDYQSLSATDIPAADSQPVNLQAAIYVAKSKAKESRRSFGTARDVVNAAQRELQPTERSLDPGE